MHEAVNDILDIRAQQPDRLSRMVVVSLVGHGVLLTTLYVMPAEWRGATPPRERVRMMISLDSGAPGPNSGGMTPISGRPVQTVAPPEPRPRVQPPPAAKVPEMIAPDPAAKLRDKARKPVDKPVEASASRKPTTGPDVKTGDARVNTGAAPIPFGGLSTMGGGGSGGVRLDVGDFCCPEYLETMIQRIQANWNKSQGASGRVVVKYTIQRDGTLTDVEVERPSNNYSLDSESRRALLYTKRLPPLPAQFTGPTLTVHLTFDYQR
jgi:TonB family protein